MVDKLKPQKPTAQEIYARISKQLLGEGTEISVEPIEIQVTVYEEQTPELFAELKAHLPLDFYVYKNEALEAIMKPIVQKVLTSIGLYTEDWSCCYWGWNGSDEIDLLAAVDFPEIQHETDC